MFAKLTIPYGKTIPSRGHDKEIDSILELASTHPDIDCWPDLLAENVPLTSCLPRGRSWFHYNRPQITLSFDIHKDQIRRLPENIKNSVWAKSPCQFLHLQRIQLLYGKMIPFFERDREFDSILEIAALKGLDVATLGTFLEPQSSYKPRVRICFHFNLHYHRVAR